MAVSAQASGLRFDAGHRNHAAARSSPQPPRLPGAVLQKSPQQMAAKLSEQEVTIRSLSAQNEAQKTRLESQAAEIAKLKAQMADVISKLGKK